MRLAYDLHIHSALSACSDKDMTPNNIVNMSLLKELDIIAVTDHNSAENLEAVVKCSLGKDILVVPGMEIETMEEIHVVCLFPGLDEANKMQEIVYSNLPSLKNREDIFGRQIILNEYDDELGSIDRFLLTAVGIPIEEVYRTVLSLNGVMIPAHIDRNSYSILSNLGSIPQHFGFKYLEVSKKACIETLKKQYPEVGECSLIVSSDAHSLPNISERESFIDIDEKSAECVISKIRNG
ncbi:PHP domain-containing protein [Pseudobacteroides cellulosolvens]|uniref:PHP domain protein n=1 Tax=Pseudobacteroides cellulosolvens ATCC 35603 = DSM 2933 TaxID=398512 RepID=A0A0L6JMM9_9FIRM|nr:PHP domain-containing protein [Pseudobacteroides cellulosolvens]KNY27020.1 PHP domain protein [Pseudobacteroides cellulosolvens ATCC 35603 = DSM 2933]